MATIEKDKKTPISAAPVAIATTVAPSREVALKGTTTSRLKSDKAEGVEVASVPVPPKQSTDEVAFQRFMRLTLMDNNREDVTTVPILDWIKDNLLQLGPNFDPANKVDRSYAEFQQANPHDREITGRYEASTQNAYADYAPYSGAGRQGRKSSSATAVTNDGFTPHPYKLDKNQARTELAADIKTVSEMYAAEAGMSPKDFAKVMGGIATIESNFGVAREVKGTKFKSSAGGAFHYLNGTITGETSQAMDDPRIAKRVAELGVTFETATVKRNGKTSQVQRLSEAEAWVLKQDNVLAGSVLAKQIIEIARKNPELKNDVDALTTRVYQSHNLGEAGARALARGGRAALEALDYKADDNNPLFFGGGASDATINQRYTKKVAGAIDSAEPLIAAAFNEGTPIQVASARQQQQNRVPLPGREPA